MFGLQYYAVFLRSMLVYNLSLLYNTSPLAIRVIDTYNVCIYISTVAYRSRVNVGDARISEIKCSQMFRKLPGISVGRTNCTSNGTEPTHAESLASLGMEITDHVITQDDKEHKPVGTTLQPKQLKVLKVPSQNSQYGRLFTCVSVMD